MKPKKQTLVVPTLKPRNPFGTSALMCKGGKHHKTEKAQRQQHRSMLKKEISSPVLDMDGP